MPVNNSKHENIQPAAGSRERTADPSDPAGRSLADALRVSFRLLTMIMIVVVGFWVLSGFATVKPYEKGVIRLFGRITGTADEGPVYTWPFPVGAVEKVGTKSRTVTIDEFWFHETAKDKTVPLDQRRVRSEGLRPVWDGALLTGDRNLLHVRLTCIYEVKDPVKYKTGLADPEGAIRAVVCSTAIRTAGAETVDALMRGGMPRFTADIRKKAQAKLDALDSGVRIISVIQSGEVTWPLQARRKYQEAADAVLDKKRKIDAAYSEAEDLLKHAAGLESSMRLIGTLEQVKAGSLEKSKDGENLIGQYEAARKDLESLRRAIIQARTAGNRKEEKRLSKEKADCEKKASDLLKGIDRELVSNAIKGEARKIIERAGSKGTSTKQRLESWHKKFLELEPECRTTKSTAFQFERQWADALDKILKSPTIEKHLLPPGKQKTILRISSDPQIRKHILREQLRQAEEQKRDKENR